MLALGMPGTALPASAPFPASKILRLTVPGDVDFGFDIDGWSSVAVTDLRWRPQGKKPRPTGVAVVPTGAKPTSPTPGPGPVAPVVTGLAASGIPEVALLAYRGAEATMARDDAGCGLHWSLVAAIGWVESNHGRFGGAQLRADGTTTKPIRGIPLDGRPGVALIRDTDGGALDGDTTYDRAVGPLQFIPSTWRFAGADGNGDARRNPGNAFDAALAAGGYLCAGDDDLRDRAQAARAVFRYNHSQAYVAAVLALADAYRRGVLPLPTVIPAALAPSLPHTPLPPASVSPPPPPVDRGAGRVPPTPAPTSTTTTTSPPTTTSTTSTTVPPTTATPTTPDTTIPDTTTTTSTTSTTSTTEPPASTTTTEPPASPATP